jgi:hypothetical protein
LSKLSNQIFGNQATLKDFFAADRSDGIYGSQFSFYTIIIRKKERIITNFAGSFNNQLNNQDF